MDEKEVNEIIKGFFVEERDWEKRFENKIKEYVAQGFQVVKPGTQPRDILYPRGVHRRESIDREILMLSYWLITRKDKGRN